ncbi:MAG: Clp protease ClpP [Atopobiaceae bacterium]|nr:Clp protease ClpP [Atopobiaceae bacterium]
MSKYFQMDVSEQSADIYIFGDITSWPWDEQDVSAYGLAKQLEELGPVDEINVRINSYGGEVAEGIAIYNALKNHPAKVTTECAGFACSIASVIFMAGDERVMNEASLLMIHNAWSRCAGNADEHRKEADDLDTVTQLSKQVYLAATDLDEAELTEWMDAETFIDSAKALERGFATKVIPIDPQNAAQSAMGAISHRVMHQKAGAFESLADACAKTAKAVEELASRLEPQQEVPIEEGHDADDERLRMAGAYLALA